MLVRSHSDFYALKTNSMDDIFHRLESFLNINGEEVSLKSIQDMKTNRPSPAIYDDLGIYDLVITC